MTRTLVYFHWKHVHLFHSLLQLVLSRGGHRVDVLIVPVILCIGISAVHLKDSIKYTVRHGIYC